MEADTPPPPPSPDDHDIDSLPTRYEDVDESTSSNKNDRKTSKNDQDQTTRSTVSLWFTTTDTNIPNFLIGLHNAVMSMDPDGCILPVDPTAARPLDKKHPPPKKISEADKDRFIRGLSLRRTGISGKVTIITSTPPDRIKKDPHFNRWSRGDDDHARIQIHISQLDSSYRFKAGTLNQYVCRPDLTGIAKLHLTAILNKVTNKKPINFEVQAENIYRGGNHAMFYTVYTETKASADWLGQTLQAANKNQSGAFFVSSSYWRLMSKSKKNGIVAKQRDFQGRTGALLIHGIADIDTPVIFGPNPNDPPSSLAAWIAATKSNGTYLFKYISPTCKGKTAIWYDTARKHEAMAWLQTADVDLYNIVIERLPEDLSNDRKQSILSSIFNDLEERRVQKAKLDQLVADGQFMRPEEHDKFIDEKIKSMPTNKNPRPHAKHSRKTPRKQPSYGLVATDAENSKKKNRRPKKNRKKNKQNKSADVMASFGGTDTAPTPLTNNTMKVAATVKNDQTTPEPRDTIPTTITTTPQRNAWIAPPNLTTAIAPGLPLSDTEDEKSILSTDDNLSPKLLEMQEEWKEVKKKNKRKKEATNATDLDGIHTSPAAESPSNSSASSQNDETITVATQRTRNSRSSNSERLQEEIDSLRKSERESMHREWALRQQTRNLEERLEERDSQLQMEREKHARDMQALRDKNDKNETMIAEMMRRLAMVEAQQRDGSQQPSNSGNTAHAQMEMVSVHANEECETPDSIMTSSIVAYNTPTRASSKRQTTGSIQKETPTDNNTTSGHGLKKRRAGGTPQKTPSETYSQEYEDSPDRTPDSFDLETDTIEFGSPFSTHSNASDIHAPLFTLGEEEASDV